MAALVTLWAVRASSRPADSEHAYGHGKIENLSALFETLLLLATSVLGSSRRLSRDCSSAPRSMWTPICGPSWSCILSIAMDYSRSRALMRVAKKYDSQALEADALHFATDIWSSVVVLFGLVGVLWRTNWASLGLPRPTRLPLLAWLWSLSWSACGSARKSINDLLDTVPSDMACAYRWPPRLRACARSDRFAFVGAAPNSSWI
jgi:divalent metal cation (Fe/Co/Zn/Cd) transporter